LELKLEEFVDNYEPLSYMLSGAVLAEAFATAYSFDSLGEIQLKYQGCMSFCFFRVGFPCAMGSPVYIQQLRQIAYLSYVKSREIWGIRI
jgi:hypothetical protein